MSSGEMVELRERVASLEREVASLRRSRASSMPEFTVVQYNILAGYLGDNTQPWFLYGIDLTDEQRKRIMSKFYERDESGKFVNEGWPKFVDGVLTPDEMAAVAECRAR